MKNWIIVIGNPQDGFIYIGPFTDNDEAIKYAESIDDSWWVVELNPTGK